MPLDHDYSHPIQMGPVANIGKVVTEFKKARGLTPLRIVVLGPPASGKSTLAKGILSFLFLPLPRSCHLFL